jgi:hypothetical protein
VLERPLRYLAIVLSLFVALGFTLFALEDMGRASTNSEHRITGYAATNPSPAGERERERRHSQAREFVDDVDDVLLAPFAGVSDQSTSRWEQRGYPTLLALLVYGFGLGYLARFMTARGTARRHSFRRHTAH